LPPQEISGEGYRISARNLAARFVAGDFYDAFPLSDGALGIAVADVSGKGMGASLIMASVKAVLPFIAEGCRAAETLTRLNHKLHGELAPREFVALAFARFEPQTGAFELANAGLPDPYLLHRDGTLAALGVPGPRLPLGARSEVAYESLTVSVSPRDRVLFFTDGLPEAPTASGEPLGYEVLARLVPVAANAETPGELLDSLFTSVRQATRPILEDDWTALLLEAMPLGIP
jgi:sigma-B regulation protein RsbU (phosphoserine phosphatase)